MSEGKQLKAKVNNNFVDIYPLNMLQNIKDKYTGITLDKYLNRYNHIYLPTAESKELIRLQVPVFARRFGLWISYEFENKYYTEIYIGPKDIAAVDINWKDDANWKLVPDIEMIYDDGMKIPNGTILPNMLSDELKQLIGNNNTIVNLVDEEDLTNNNGVINFKNKEYYPELASGLGHKILRKNWISGRNILTQDMINKSNIIYEIRYDYDLQKKTIEIPNNCVLKFEGGSLKNGTIIGNNTAIDCNYNKQIFFNIIIDGIFNYNLNACWINAKNIGTTDERPTLLLTNNDKGFRYFDTTINKPIYWDGSKWLISDVTPENIRHEGTTLGRPINVPNGFIYKDTTIGKVIWKLGNKWIDNNGEVI